MQACGGLCSPSPAHKPNHTQDTAELSGTGFCQHSCFVFRVVTGAAVAGACCFMWVHMFADLEPGTGSCFGRGFASLAGRSRTSNRGAQLNPPALGDCGHRMELSAHGWASIGPTAVPMTGLSGAPPWSGRLCWPEGLPGGGICTAPAGSTLGLQGPMRVRRCGSREHI